MYIVGREFTPHGICRNLSWYHGIYNIMGIIYKLSYG